MENRKLKKNILAVAVVMAVFFVALMLYTSYISVIEAGSLAKNPLNHRQAAYDENIMRGSILDAHGNVLAEGKASARKYPYGKVAAPVTRYIGSKLGASGVENYAGGDLSGHSPELSMLGPISQLFQSERGADVKLTIDMRVQKAIYDAMKGRKGSAVVLDARTGAVIAMVSLPSYDPSSVEKNWSQLSNDKDSPLLNRAISGLYPPGSTIKPLILDAALRSNAATQNETFKCTGALDVGDGHSIRESHGAVHGKVDLRHALMESCNVTFGTLAMRMEGKGLSEVFDRFGFGRVAEGEISESTQRLPDFAKLSKGETAQIGIGQGSLLVTPLHMALLASAFANDGKVMKPYLIDEAIFPGGATIKKGSPSEWYTATDSASAALVEKWMRDVVTNGTGTRAIVKGANVAGKTGTAENSSGEDHAWFIGSADVDGRRIAFAIIVENGGGGGRMAAPIAKAAIESMMH